MTPLEPTPTGMWSKRDCSRQNNRYSQITDWKTVITHTELFFYVHVQCHDNVQHNPIILCRCSCTWNYMSYDVCTWANCSLIGLTSFSNKLVLTNLTPQLMSNPTPPAHCTIRNTCDSYMHLCIRTHTSHTHVFYNSSHLMHDMHNPSFTTHISSFFLFAHHLSTFRPQILIGSRRWQTDAWNSREHTHKLAHTCHTIIPGETTDCGSDVSNAAIFPMAKP